MRLHTRGWQVSLGIQASDSALAAPGAEHSPCCGDVLGAHPLAQPWHSAAGCRPTGLQLSRPLTRLLPAALLRLRPFPVADPFLIRRSSWGVQRDVLPLRPYMQPPRMQRNPDGSSSKPSAVLNPCQLLRWAPRRSGTTGGGVTRRQAKHHVLLQDQRAPVHTLVAPAGGRAPARALLQGCTRLLHRLPRVLRVL